VRVVIVDDEAPARRRLIRMLEAIDGVEVVGEAGDADETVEVVARVRPDALFLDIRLPGVDGLTLARRVLELPPIVFVTAYDEFAVQAFEVNAVDYLLKPVRAERLAAAVTRLGSRTSAAEASRRALEAVRPATRSTRLVTSERGTVRFFEAKQITRLHAADKYVVFQADGHERLTDESLNALEARLSGLGFLRVHRSELVRLGAVKALRSEPGLHELELVDGQRVRVSRRELGTVRRALGLADDGGD
jgi:DNA-binding LytR/AlgR family response regulator